VKSKQSGLPAAGKTEVRNLALAYRAIPQMQQFVTFASVDRALTAAHGSRSIGPKAL
jgi:hypothetical protein